MKIGQIGTLSENLFEENDDKWIYLATVVDVTDYWRAQHPNKVITKTYYDLRYNLIQEGDNFSCTVIYLGQVVIPDIVMSEGADHKMHAINTEFWQYHKVLITMRDHTEVRYLHERCLQYFTWHDTD